MRLGHPRGTDAWPSGLGPEFRSQGWWFNSGWRRRTELKVTLPWAQFNHAAITWADVNLLGGER